MKKPSFISSLVMGTALAGIGALSPLTAVAGGPPKTIEGECIFFDKVFFKLLVDIEAKDGVVIKIGTPLDLKVTDEFDELADIRLKVVLKLKALGYIKVVAGVKVDIEVGDIDILSVGLAADCFDPHIKFIN
jgi:hypothetical protein